jgi:hypothetical protein
MTPLHLAAVQTAIDKPRFGGAFLFGSVKNDPTPTSASEHDAEKCVRFSYDIMLYYLI